MEYIARQPKKDLAQELGLGISTDLQMKLEEKQEQHKINLTVGLWA